MDCTRKTLWILITLGALAASVTGCKGPPPTNPKVIAREPNALFWGDTHVHSSVSEDARPPARRSANLDTAYRWAKGLPVVEPYSQARVQLRDPLDFVIVTDHAERLERGAWESAIATADQHYAPCKFTTFIGWEWTSELEGQNLHRTIFMDGDKESAREVVPFSATDSPHPEDLWRWLEATSRRVRTDFIAIPHSPDPGGGAMFPETDSNGQALTDAYAEARMRWEPVAEVTQVRGDSETHPTLSPADDFADFERPATEFRSDDTEVDEGAYTRSALLRGLQIQQSIGANPFQFGMIGASASHTGLASADEASFWGAPPPWSDVDDSSDPGHLDHADASAQGLTGVWAEENTRASIFEAFKRREVYATTGPRIRVRLFGGWRFEKKQAAKASMVMTGYTFGHPMGSVLGKRPEGKAPNFLMYAVKEPDGANLDRMQIVKGWIDADGKTHERVYDVVWSGERERGEDGKVPPVTNTVDLATARYENTEGAAALHAFWSDPEFDPKQPAFYYLRVLQIPTPRHTLYDAVARGTDPNETGHPPTIQERAYTSPIWYVP